MQRVVTGIGDAGASCVISAGSPPVALHASTGADGLPQMVRLDGSSPKPVPAPGEAVVHQLWSLPSHPKASSVDPTLAPGGPSFEVAPAASQWILTEMGPHLSAPMHATSTVDYGIVINGEVDLVLEDGVASLRAGDTVVINAVQHAWRTGSTGCTIATVQVGVS